MIFGSQYRSVVPFSIVTGLSDGVNVHADYIVGE